MFTWSRYGDRFVEMAHIYQYTRMLEPASVRNPRRRYWDALYHHLVREPSARLRRE
jgi:hypothetical protein